MPGFRLLLLACIVTVAAAAGAAAKVLKQEPPPGGIQCGETVLVDDGSCPAGQITQIIGGCNFGPGADLRGTGRRRACVKK